MCESSQHPNHSEPTVGLQGSGNAQETAPKSGTEPGDRLLLHGASIVGDSKEKKLQPSRKRIEANRRNAQKSTGPKTDRGKARVRFNAVKHSLLSKQILLLADDEEHKEFERLLAGLCLHFQPVGYLESLDVQEIAVCYWKKRRALRWEMRLQPQISNHTPFEPQDLHRTYESIVTKLLGDDEGTLKEDQTASVPKITVPGEVIPNLDALNTIVRYDAAIDRRLSRTLIHLERLQRARKGEYVPAPVSISVEER